jgi:hypothetical protein
LINQAEIHMNDLYENLHSEGIISDASFEKLNKKYSKPLFSVHWELKSLLYLGVLMLTGGLGLLIYENIDTIGHQFVLALIAIIWIGCFGWCYKNKLPFGFAKVRAPNDAFDYILLLGAISFLTFVGYLQYQYNLFGNNYGMSTFIPMVVSFFIAYYFDHLGILNMAIINLAVWMGVSVTPKQLLLHSDFNSQTIIYIYLLLGILLLLGAMLTQRFNFKRHFKFSYSHYGVHVAFITLLAGYFHYYNLALAAVWMLGLAVLAILVYRDALKNKSFYFLLLVVLYSYIAISSLMVRLCMLAENGVLINLLFYYFIGSAVGFIFLLIHLNKKIKLA